MKLENSDYESISKIQQQASDPQVSAYVSASAGTGKTKILVDRFIRLMLHGAKPEAILCLTFTNAAAAEMRARIISKLRAFKELPRDLLLDELFRIGEGGEQIRAARKLYDEFLAALENVKIQTIHSFANQVVNWVKSKDLKFVKIIEPAQLDSLLERSIEECLLENPTWDLLVNYEVSQLVDYVKSLHYKGMDYALHIANEISDNLPEMHFGQKDLDNIVNSKDIVAIKKTFLTQAGEPKVRVLTKAQFNGDETLPEKISYYQARLIEYLEAANLEEIKSISNQLIQLHSYVKRALDKFKLSRFELEYSDILDQFLKVVADDPQVLRSIDYRVDHILVDEAQDLSSHQWVAIMKIAEDFFAGHSQRELLRTIFVVGDFKQSIYSFQGAKPQLFIAMREYFARQVKAVGWRWVEVELNSSFRSVASVLTFVDRLFNELKLQEQLGASEDIAHKIVKQGEGSVNLYSLFEGLAKADDEDGWVMPTDDIDDPKKRLVAAVVNLVLRKLKRDRVLERDIMLIFRKRSGVFSAIANELRKHGIKVADQDKSRPYDKLIYQDLFCLAEVYGYPHDRYKLACFLKSPFMNWTEEELLKQLDGFKLNQLPYDSLVELYHRYLFEMGAVNDFVRRFGQGAMNDISFFLGKLLEFEKQKGAAAPLLANWFKRNVTEVESTSASDGVRFMTAHSAKGLQAKVVILADAASSEQQPVEQLVFDDEHCYFIPAAELTTRYLRGLKDRHKQEEYNESLRLLYVALTRAEEELHIFGIKNNRLKGSWYDLASKVLEPQDYILEPHEGASGTKSELLLRPINDWKRENYHSQKQNLGQLLGEYIHSYLELYGKSYALSSLERRVVAQFGRPQWDDIETKAKAFVSKYPQIFASPARCEFTLESFERGASTILRIDRLVFMGDEIWVVDYKSDTHRDASKYNSQLSRYKAAVEKSFKLPVRCFIAWISICELEEVVQDRPPAE